MSDHHFTGRPAVLASRAAKPECRTTSFTGRPAIFASRAKKPECRTTSFTGRPAIFASRAKKPACRPTIFTSRPDRLLVCYCTISFPLGSRQEVFASRGRKTCMSAHHFHQSAGPFTTLRFYYFISIGFKAGGFLHLGPQKLHVGLPFSPVGRTVYYFTISFPLGSRVQGRRFLHLGPQNLHVSLPFSPVGRPFLHLGPHDLHVVSRVLHVGPPILHVRPLASPRVVFASRTANPACRLTSLHVGQTYPRVARLALELRLGAATPHATVFDPFLTP